MDQINIQLGDWCDDMQAVLVGKRTQFGGQLGDQRANLGAKSWPWAYQLGDGLKVFYWQ